jgi:hypothetical protein
VSDHAAFLASIKHYKNQHYGIAIDDVGAGYSGLNTISEVKPNLIKLDMNLVRDIDKDETKRLLCKAMLDFGKGADIRIIAEGIETGGELGVLIKLGVDFGQGYFLGIPQETFASIAHEKVEMIKKYYTEKCTGDAQKAHRPIIGNLASPIHYFPSSDAAALSKALRVDCNMPISKVAKLAMQRPFERLYHPIVVERDGKYCGAVTVKNLLDAYTQMH